MPRISSFYGIIIWMYWASLHRNELLENWNLMTEDKPLKRIEPLK